MSFIERALGKAKRSADAAASPVSRAAATPELIITADIRQGLGLDASHELQHQHSSEYRHIKRQVVAEVRANPAERVLLVASALAGEGKSFTAANLAFSLALEPDYTVLLIDADVINPQLTRTLGLSARPGLMNALVDPALDVESLIISTNVEGLSVMPAGSSSENATEYFGSDRMQDILARLLSMPNRIVLIDSLPLLLTTEVRALMPLASQVLLVVRAESTSETAVQRALALIGEDINVKLVLNAVSRTHIARYLGYDYGFDYNYSPKR
jgi:protein-tyrosine kinase